jgi:hypothetical protein
MTQKTKKNSAAKKLVPAAGMLAVSAMMLASSTYAWFTMAREVEVNNIKMTATVPEDIQISLGHLNTTGADDTSKGLAGSEFYLNGSADDGNAQTPATGVDKISLLDWANTADISHYYQLGKIIPASSTTGEDIYFTPDASGVGKTLKGGAKHYQAADALAAQNDAEGKAYRTSLHATTGATDAWSAYVTATDYNKTNDDGYYVDIPVWIRTSSTSGANLAVDAFVTTNAAVDTDDLYMAARVSVLNATTGAPLTNIVEVRKDNWSGTSIVDYMATTNATGEAVASIGTEGANANIATYANATRYAGTQVVALAAGADGEYGTPTKVILRVWLEGEDPNCWNANAGQDFNISLKFTKEAIDPYVSPIAFTDAQTANPTTMIHDGDRVTITNPNAPAGGVANSIYEVSNVGSDGKGTWRLVSGTYYAAPVGYKYQITIGANAAADVTGSDSIIDYLNNNVTLTSEISSAITLSQVQVPQTITLSATRTTSGDPAVTTWSYSPDIPTGTISNFGGAATQSAYEASITVDGVYTVVVTYTAPAPAGG